MREIKFRVWDEDEKEYMKVDYLTIDNDGTFSVITSTEEKEPEYTSSEYYNIILEQYTGLKDKDGKEIYEGDIIELDANRISTKGVYVVVWKSKKCGFGLKCVENNYRSNDKGMHSGKQMKIIGNIHDK